MRFSPAIISRLFDILKVREGQIDFCYLPVHYVIIMVRR